MPLFKCKKLRPQSHGIRAGFHILVQCKKTAIFVFTVGQTGAKKFRFSFWKNRFMVTNFAKKLFLRLTFKHSWNNFVNVRFTLQAKVTSGHHDQVERIHSFFCYAHFILDHQIVHFWLNFAQIYFFRSWSICCSFSIFFFINLSQLSYSFRSSYRIFWIFLKDCSEPLFSIKYLLLEFCRSS